MRFLLSIHDVWPGNFPLVTGYLARLRSLGAMNMALLVVPAFHGRPPMEADAEFVAWLREESGRGTELFLHGYHHLMGELAEGPAYRGRRNAWGHWVNRTLVAREAEFCGLSQPDQDRLLGLGMASWRLTGLPLAGFVAPTWHGSPPRESLKESGIGLWETRFFVRRLADGRSRFAPPLAWDLSAGNGQPRLFGGETWLRIMLGLPLIKVALHPGDLKIPETEAILERVIAAGSASAYGDVFGPHQGGESASVGNRNATSGAHG